MSELKNIVVGIDLGTTNCCVSIVEGGEAKIIYNLVPENTTPSVVDYSVEPPRVGKEALKQSIVNPQFVIRGSKRIIGLGFENSSIVNQMKKHVGYEICDHNGLIGIELSKNKRIYPTEVASEILRYLRKTIIEYVGCKSDSTEKIKAVITVPAYFDDAQKTATKQAGEFAGFDVLRIIQEPTAAVLAYTQSKDIGSKIIAVYDLGGGTFDTSIVLVTGKEHADDTTLIEVLATKGDAFLGGEDFDQRIVNDFIADIKKQHPYIDTTDRNPTLLQRLRSEAEDAKKELSNHLSKTIELPYIGVNGSTPVHWKYALDRAKLNRLCEDLVRKTGSICDNVISDAKKIFEKKCPGETFKIDDVILVGGMTRMIAVRDFVKEKFNKAPRTDVNPDEAVAKGAAIQGAILKGKDNMGILVIDVTPLSLGIETLGGVFTRIITRNSSIPIKQSQVFSTAVDNQPQVQIKVFQGEREMANENKSLGEFILSGISPAPRGVPQIEVTFDIDQNGIVKISALDKQSKKEANIEVRNSHSMSKEETERLVKESQMFAEIDKKVVGFAEKLGKAESTLYIAEKGRDDFSKAESLKQKIDDELMPAINTARELIENTKQDFENLKSDLAKIKLANHSIDQQKNEFNKKIDEVAPAFDLLKQPLEDLDKIVAKIGEEFRNSQSNSSDTNEASQNSGDQSDTGSDSNSNEA